jgi:hypothetical protein
LDDSSDHQGTHNDAFFEQLHKSLTKAERNGTVRETLTEIREAFESGYQFDPAFFEI